MFARNHLLHLAISRHIISTWLHRTDLKRIQDVSLKPVNSDKPYYHILSHTITRLVMHPFISNMTTLLSHKSSDGSCVRDRGSVYQVVMEAHVSR